MRYSGLLGTRQGLRSDRGSLRRLQYQADQGHEAPSNSITIMDSSRIMSGPSKRHTFVWPPAFSQRQTKLYPAENVFRVQKIMYPPESSVPLPTPVPVSNEDIEERFVNNRHQHDVHRYLCRKLQIGNFLQAADIGTLRGPPQRSLAKQNALLDDRNSETVTRLQPAGNCRPFRGPLSAQELFVELSQDVRY